MDLWNTSLHGRHTFSPDVSGWRGGRPHWPVKLYVKCLMLQKWFNLSDPQLEEQLRDRISFRRFVGLGLAEPTPDETSLVVFRRRLREAGTSGRCSTRSAGTWTSWD